MPLNCTRVTSSQGALRHDTSTLGGREEPFARLEIVVGHAHNLVKLRGLE